MVSRTVVATSRAGRTGFQNAALRTKVPSTGRRVACAAATSDGKGAGQSRWSGTCSTS